MTDHDGVAHAMSEEIIHAPRFMQLVYGLGEPPQFDLDVAALTRLVRPKHGGRAHCVEGPHPVLIPSARGEAVAPSCTVRFRLLTRTPSEYTDVVAVGRPCDGMCLRAENLPANMEFSAGGAGAEQTGDHEWTTRSGLIDGQHMRCWWRLKRPPRILG
jgi:hypothetical protein